MKNSLKSSIELSPEELARGITCAHSNASNNVCTILILKEEAEEEEVEQKKEEGLHLTQLKLITISLTVDLLVHVGGLLASLPS